MSIKYNVVAITGTYQSQGQEKKRYENVGMVIEKDGKFFLKLNKLAFNDDGNLVNFFSLYPPREQTQQTAKPAPPPQDDFDDDIPF